MFRRSFLFLATFFITLSFVFGTAHAQTPGPASTSLPQYNQFGWSNGLFSTSRCYVSPSGEGLVAPGVDTSGTSVFNGAKVATIQGFECILGNILTTATTLIGLVAFVMLIYGSFLYLSSGGNSSGIENGKKTMTYAIIGIIVAVLAFFVLTLIADFTGVEGIKTFNLNVQSSNQQ